MRKIFFLTLIIVIIFSENINAQKYVSYFPEVDTINGEICWKGRSVKTITNDAELIFEGRILSDSVFKHPSLGRDFTEHKVLVLKEFKGVFISDTIRVANNGGKVMSAGWEDGGRISYIHPGDEMMFFVSTQFNKKMLINDPDLYFISGLDPVKVCNKKDIVSEVYEPIEKAIGQGYVDVHPNTCASKLQK
jgi:hypothetical protein